MIDTGDATVDSLVAGLLHGNDDARQTEITYTFDLPADLAEDDEYSRLNQTTIDRHMAVFAHVSSFTQLNFTEVDPEQETADFYFTFRIDTPTAYVIQYENAVLHVYNPDRDNPVLGSYTDHLILHEVGHGLGLEHGHDFGVGMPRAYQGHSWSVMSYRAHPDTESLYYSDSHGPETYMLADIAALQHLYGANFDHQTDDTTYTVDFGTGEFFINGESQGTPLTPKLLRAVWDGGGVDTLDLSNARQGLEIDLRPGEFTSFGQGYVAYQGEDANRVPLYAEGNIANPYLYQGNTSSLLENAIGGDFNDMIVGNQVTNSLSGGGGDDTLFGLEGDDSLSGGAGDDFIVDGIGQTTATGDSGEDFIAALSSDSDLSGGGDADILIGGIDADRLDGGAGNDVLRGDAGMGLLFGADTLIGGQGDDLLMGGRGADQFVFRPDEGNDTIAGFAASALSPGEAEAVGAETADFVSSLDKIVLDGFDGVTAETVLDFVSDNADGHAVFAAEDTTITFFNVSADVLTTEDFIFL